MKEGQGIREYTDLGQEGPNQSNNTSGRCSIFTAEFSRGLSLGRDSRARQAHTVTIAGRQPSSMNMQLKKIFQKSTTTIPKSPFELVGCIVELISVSVGVCFSQKWNDDTSYRQMAAEAGNTTEEAAWHSNSSIRTQLPRLRQAESLKLY